MQDVSNKIVTDYRKLSKKIDAHKTLGHKIVCTIGSWDMLHIGHLRYLHKAKEFGDILVVGVDSDRGIRSYKGRLRPIIPQEERMEMLAYQNCVDYITLIDDIDKKGMWHYKLIKDIHIDTFVSVSNDSYTKKQLKIIKKYSAKLEEIPRQADKTSSTDIIQKVIKGHLLNELKETKR